MGNCCYCIPQLTAWSNVSEIDKHHAITEFLVNYELLLRNNETFDTELLFRVSSPHQNIIYCVDAFYVCVGALSRLGIERHARKIEFVYTSRSVYRISQNLDYIQTQSQSQSQSGGLKIPHHIALRLIDLAVIKGEQCPVTLEPLTKETAIVTNCGHVFSREMIREKEKTIPTCPLCREPFIVCSSLCT